MIFFDSFEREEVLDKSALFYLDWLEICHQFKVGFNDVQLLVRYSLLSLTQRLMQIEQCSPWRRFSSQEMCHLSL